jgi:hypothetical protein
MTKIIVVNPADGMKLILPLIEENWKETGLNQDIELNPDVAMYDRAFNRGSIFGLAVYDGDEVIGYCSIYMGGHIRNPDFIIASNDALFLKEEYRGFISGKLIARAEKEAALRGAKVFMWGCRTGTELKNTLIKHGGKEIETTVMRKL